MDTGSDPAWIFYYDLDIYPKQELDEIMNLNL